MLVDGVKKTHVRDHDAGTPPPLGKMAKSKAKKTGGVARSASSASSSSHGLSHEWEHIPALVVFDLDFTFWHPEMYELDGSPFRKNPRTGAVTDCRGTQVHFFDAVHSVLSVLETQPQFADTAVAVASSTTEPQWAKTCMRLMDVHVSSQPTARREAEEEEEEADGHTTKKALQSIIDYEAIYPRNKQVHFKQLQKDSGVAYEDMLFFDNEYGNIANVGRLGVVCCYCPHGLSDGAWIQGMEAFQLAKRGKGGGD